jgi:hypothetical protein
MSDNSENEAIEENLEVPLTKQKKARSQAQIEAFEKVKEKRKQNLETKKQEKLLSSAKLLIEEESKRMIPKHNSACGRGGVVGEHSSLHKRKVKPQPEPESESESEEEVIIVKKSKPKKKVRKIIIEESSSEDDREEEESEYEPEPQPVKRRNQVVRVIRPNPNEFFC